MRADAFPHDLMAYYPAGGRLHGHRPRPIALSLPPRRAGCFDRTSYRGSRSPITVHDYVKKILTARVYDVATESPLDPMPRLSERIGSPVHLKREDLQPVFSFK